MSEDGSATGDQATAGEALALGTACGASSGPNEGIPAASIVGGKTFSTEVVSSFKSTS